MVIASIWNSATGGKIKEFTKANRRIVGIRYLENSQQLAIGGLDGLIRTFDLASLPAVPPTPTAEPTPQGFATPTAIPTLPATPAPTITPGHNNQLDYHFSLRNRFSMDDMSSIIHTAGGFDKHEAGKLEIVNIPGDPSNKGLKITVAPGQVSLILFPQILLGIDGPAVLRAKLKSTGREAVIVLGALDGFEDGTVITNLTKRCSEFNDMYKYFETVYDPPSNALRPFFQVSNLDGKETNEIILDEFEIYNSR